MAKRNEIIQYIDDLLAINEFEDLGVNGLQVEGREEIHKIILGVSTSERLYRAAVEQGADMIIVHHGAFWKNADKAYILTGIHRNRMALLIKNDINLAGYHLPLDAHPEIGNNACILNRLGMEQVQQVEVGILGQLPAPEQFDKFVERVDKQLETSSLSFPFGSASAHRVLVISGSSSRYYQLALDHDADTFLGGDMREEIVRELEEVGLNFIHAGHYNTEKFGVQALGQKLEKDFAVTCKFIDISNPV